jgi:hypothetical protein
MNPRRGANTRTGWLTDWQTDRLTDWMTDRITVTRVVTCDSIIPPMLLTLINLHVVLTGKRNGCHFEQQSSCANRTAFERTARTVTYTVQRYCALWADHTHRHRLPWGSFGRIKRLQPEADRLFQSNTMIINAWSLTSTQSHVSLAWCINTFTALRLL